MMRVHRSVSRAFSLQAGTGLFLAFVILGVACGAAAQDATTSRIAHAEKEPQNWLTFYGNYRG